MLRDLKKTLLMEEQNKVLSRALIKEVGDGITLEEAVDEGRKGRAQKGTNDRRQTNDASQLLKFGSGVNVQ